MATKHQESLFLSWAILAGINFTIDPKKSLKAEFTRLAKDGGWLPHINMDTWCFRWQQCFGEEYIWGGRSQANATKNTQPSTKVYLRVADHIFPEGEDGTETLQLWQALCKDVGLEVVPLSITKCKKALKSLHVNLIDLIDGLSNGTPVRHFDSRKALAKYTCRGHAFPKVAAKEEGFISSLLRHVKSMGGRSACS
ncbi:hypothetical protein BDV96DRAFT_562784 [Lophiotrema nucula]|uniref:Uncharacterized protein n=1 Tax=Lophiotrema nucula TaxID=690887 RepID=A0A6A5ZUV8_9PLEO|nr:hypothetical protein BDV96DRAFT_562784 [Lophiotrema nucula]